MILLATGAGNGRIDGFRWIDTECKVVLKLAWMSWGLGPKFRGVQVI